MKTGILILLAAGLLIVGAYKFSTPNSHVTPANSVQGTSGEAPENGDSAPGVTSSYSDLPQVNAGMSIPDAYAAIPHRRTVWSEGETTVPAGEREYLDA